MIQETTSKLKLSWWPSPQDYNEAIQITATNLQDPELQQALVYTDANGLPRPVTGSFASVYRLHCLDKDFALRLFLRNISDQEARYSLISDFVQHDDLPYTVTFDFLRQGIKVMGEWLPALKMDWVDGPSLDEYIVENLTNPEKLAQLADKFMAMMDDLAQAGIAHGDLQHGNIILWNDQLRLVDYDGMFVPAMHGFQANELGHRNYQHPSRAAEHFGPYLDNFSAWVIHASIKALQIDSRLFHQLGGGDDCLLFKQSDFLSPLQSPAFAAFEHHHEAQLNALGRFLRLQLKHNPAVVPPLRLPVPDVATSELDPIPSGVSHVRTGARLVRGSLPDWLDQKNATALSTGNHTHTPNSTETSGHPAPSAPSTLKPSPTPASWTVPVKATASAQWIKPTPASPPPSVTLPAELLIKPLRKVEFNQKCGHIGPDAWQALMLLNPLVGIMIYSGAMAFGVDYQLRAHGQVVTATVQSVNNQKNDSTVDVHYDFKFDGKPYYGVANRGDYGQYKVGQQVALRVLPSNPTISEGIGVPAGTTQGNDLGTMFGCLIVNLFLEFLIWSKAIKHKDLAAGGTAALARVVETVTENGIKGELIYYACLSFYHQAEIVTTKISVSAAEFAQLKRGEVEPILYDPYDTRSVVLYKFCRYHPINPPVPLPLPSLQQASQSTQPSPLQPSQSQPSQSQPSQSQPSQSQPSQSQPSKSQPSQSQPSQSQPQSQLLPPPPPPPPPPLPPTRQGTHTTPQQYVGPYAPLPPAGPAVKSRPPTSAPLPTPKQPTQNQPQQYVGPHARRNPPGAPHP